MRGAKQKEMFEISDLRRRDSPSKVRLSVCPPGGEGEGGRGYSDIFIHT